jgi:glycosyltransferase involved in cell wall biosynthesis
MSSRPLRVLMVTPLSPLQPGGVQRYVWELSTRLVDRQVHVEILCTDPEREEPRLEQQDRLTVRTVPAWPRGWDWCFAPGMWQEMGRASWDLVHVQSYHTLVAPLAMTKALRLRVPYCLTFHGGGHTSELRNRSRPLQRRLLAPLLARAAGLVAVARFEVDLFSEPLGIPREKFRVIPVGTDLTVRDDVDVTGAGGPPAIASIGRLERYKGHHRLIEALPEVLKARPDARVVIVGRGPYEDELRKYAEELGVGDRVDITSVRPGDTTGMAELLSRLSLVVLMSEFETYPQVAIEAAAARRPMIVADDGAGLREMAEDGLARMVSLDSSPAGLAGAILEELDRPVSSQRPGLTSWDDCADAMLELYNDVLRST